MVLANQHRGNDSIRCGESLLQPGVRGEGDVWIAVPSFVGYYSDGVDGVREEEMNLTPEERKRFITYCRMEAASYDSLAKQLPPELNSHLRRNVAAYSYVANHLDSAEVVAL